MANVYRLWMYEVFTCAIGEEQASGYASLAVLRNPEQSFLSAHSGFLARKTGQWVDAGFGYGYRQVDFQVWMGMKQGD